MSLLVIASGLYRLLAKRMRGYSDAQARTLFRDIIDIPATISAAGDTVTVNFHRRAHLPIILASGLMDNPIEVPWWGGQKLLMTSRTTRSVDLSDSSIEEPESPISPQ